MAASSVAEAALEAWLDCKPQGYILDERRVPGLLPLVASHLLAMAPESRSRDLGELFASKRGRGLPVFQQLLRARGGEVHFVFFWKAFGEVAHMAEEVSPSEGLASEIETLRDGVLRQLEEGSKEYAPTLPQAGVPAKVLLEELHRAAGMSGHPQFWQSALVLLSEKQDSTWLSLEELTCVLLSWLREAMMWEHGDASGAHASRQPSVASSVGSRECEGLPVCLHIYDVSQEESIQRLNSILAHEYSPVKLGGVFHAGVEVNGLEWCFGFSFSATRPGVWCIAPKSHPQHHYRETAYCGRTKVSAQDIGHIISEMLEEYPGHDYDLLRRNCCHFADDMCQRLGVNGIPGWVHRLARVGANVDTVLQATLSVKDRLLGSATASRPAARRPAPPPVPPPLESSLYRSAQGGLAPGPQQPGAKQKVAGTGGSEPFDVLLDYF